MENLPLQPASPARRAPRADPIDTLRAALDRCTGTVAVFFRDDGGGWGDPALRELVQLFADEGVPLDVAVIPAAIGEHTAEWLAARTGAALGVHQHGYQHASHERCGCACEFGASRGFRRQRQDIALGRHRLKSLFGRRLDPIFTPPWNRCTLETARALGGLGFSALSRDAAGEPLPLPGKLREIPVTVDWLGLRHGGTPDLAAIALRLAAQLQACGPIGIRLGHAAMGAADRLALRPLLALLRGHLLVDCLPMRALCASPRFGAAA